MICKRLGHLDGIAVKLPRLRASAWAHCQRHGFQSSSRAYWALTSKGVLMIERSFVESCKDHGRRVVLMPMVHLAGRSFFEATLRHERFSSFHYVFHEGVLKQTASDSVYSTWRYMRSLQEASLTALLMEIAWIIFFRGPLAVSNRVCKALGWQPLVMQPDPLRSDSTPANDGREKSVDPTCKLYDNSKTKNEHSKKVNHRDSSKKDRLERQFIDTDSTSNVETLLSMLTFGRYDPRAQRTVKVLLDLPVPPNSTFVVPWGFAHMPYFHEKLCQNGFREVEESARFHVAISWGTFASIHIVIWCWWWAIHAIADAAILWRNEGRIAIDMPLYWLWGATLHIGGVARKDEVMGVESLHPGKGVLKDYWKL